MSPDFYPFFVAPKQMVKPEIVNGRRVISFVHHKCEGGSAITNLAPEEAPIYEEAIKRTGDPYLELHPKPYGGHLNDNYSFHDAYPTQRDLSGFWEHFRQIEKEP